MVGVQSEAESHVSLQALGLATHPESFLPLTPFMVTWSDGGPIVIVMMTPSQGSVLTASHRVSEPGVQIELTELGGMRGAYW